MLEINPRHQILNSIVSILKNEVLEDCKVIKRLVDESYLYNLVTILDIISFLRRLGLLFVWTHPIFF